MRLSQKNKMGGGSRFLQRMLLLFALQFTHNEDLEVFAVNSYTNLNNPFAALNIKLHLLMLKKLFDMHV